MSKITSCSTQILLNEKEVSSRYSIHVQTLRNWRCVGKGPAYVKLSRLVRYPIRDLESYFQARRVDPERSE